MKTLNQTVLASLVIFIMLANALSAQINIYPATTNTTAELNEITKFDSLRVLCVGYEGVILRSTDGGGTWLKCNLDGVSIQFLTVATLPNGYAFVGGQNALYISTNYGESWSRQSTFLNSRITKIIAKQSGSIMVCTKEGYFYKSADFGLTWSSGKQLSQYPLYGMAFQNEELGYCVGGDIYSSRQGQVYKTGDGGKSWTLTKVGTCFLGCDVRPDGILTAVATNGEDVTSTDQGTTWYKTNVPIDAQWHYTVKYAFNKGMIVGGNYMTSVVNYSSDGFNFFSIDIPNDEWVYSAEALTESTWLVCGSSGKIFKLVIPDSTMTNGFKKLNTMTTNKLNSIDFYSNEIGIAVGNKGTIIRTIDAGNSWASKFNDTSENLISVRHKNNLSVAISERGYIFTSNNDGENWNITSELPGTLSAIEVLSENSAIVGNYLGELFMSNDSCKTWAKVFQSDAGAIRAIKLINEKIYVSAGSFSGPKRAAVYMSSNFGSSFVDINYPSSTDFSNTITATKDANTIMFSGIVGTVKLFKLEPIPTWVDNSAITSSQWIYGSTMNEQGLTFIVGGNISSGYVAYSLDNTTWTKKTFYTTKWLYDVSSQQNFTYICGDSGIILRAGALNLSIIAPSTSVKDELQSVQVSDFKLGAYPNPFNPSSKIVVNAPESGEFSYDIFDIAGQQILHGNLGYKVKGNFEFSINLNKQPSGMYILVGKLGSSVARFKLMLIK